MRNGTQPGINSSENSALRRVAELEKELAVAEERKNGIEGQMHHLSETVDGERADVWNIAGSRMKKLSDQRREMKRTFD